MGVERIDRIAINHAQIEPTGTVPIEKTPMMRQIEERFGGRPIEEILHGLHWENEKSLKDMATELGIKRFLTVYHWMRRLGLKTHSKAEGFAIYSKDLQKVRDVARRGKETRLRKKVARIQEVLGANSELELKEKLEATYTQECSIKKVSKAISRKGVVVSEPFVRRLMKQVGIEAKDLGGRIDMVRKSEVEEAFRDGRFSSLTPKENDVLKLRYLSPGGPPSQGECARVLGLGGKTRQAVHDVEARGLKRLGIL